MINDKLLYRSIKLIRYCIVFFIMISMLGCEKFLNPDLPNVAETDELFTKWDDYRSAGLGLYALQQRLVDQLFVLGEVRGDLLNLTDNANSELEEVYNYEFNPENEFMSPKGFYRLIAASNALALKLEQNHPWIFNTDSIPFDKMEEDKRDYVGLYGEVICMRAWAYFNMVRIFEVVPYIPQNLETEEEINDYVISGDDRAFLDKYALVDTLTNQLESYIGDNRIGVLYNTEAVNDETWSVTAWNIWAYYALMGQMNLSVEHYTKAIEYFEKIIYNTRDDYYFLNLKQFDREGYKEDKIGYQPQNNEYWKRMFRNFDLDEHIYVIWFNKERMQQHRIQYYLSDEGVNMYALTPSPNSVLNWETQWHDATFVRDPVEPKNMYMVELGYPGDFIRGHGASYAYKRNGNSLSDEEYNYMLYLKQNGLFGDVQDYMNGVDTVVYKYSIGKDPYDLDAHYTIFRAGSIHLYYAEALNAIGRYRDAEDVLNRGIASGESSVSGVRRRAYLSLKQRINSTPVQNVEEGIEILDVMPLHDPYTNEIIGFRDYSGQQSEKAFLRDSLILQERILECAWEGERFYDLIRMAERWNDPSILAEKIAVKFPAAKRNEILNLLLDHNNWYIPYFKIMADS